MFTQDYLFCGLCDVIAPVASCEICETRNHCGYCGDYEDCESVLEVI